MKQRLDYIDIAKGIGIILVVLSHIRNSDVVNYALAFYVTIFFFCSGYTTTLRSDASIKDNFIRHTVKLLKPYFFFSILLFLISRQFYLQGIFGIFYSRYSLFPFGSNEIYRLMICQNYPLWFLTCMVVSYLFFYLIIYHPKYQYHLVSLYLMITIFMTYLPILLPWSIDTAFFMAIFMFMGMQMRNKLPNVYASKHIHPIVIFSIIIYLLLMPLCYDVNLSVREYGSSIGVCLIAGVTGCIVTIYMARLLEGTIGGKVLQKIGRHSLTIFCIQIPFLFWGKDIAETILCPPQSQLQFIATVIFQTLFTLTGGYALSVIFHKNERIKKIIF